MCVCKVASASRLQSINYSNCICLRAHFDLHIPDVLIILEMDHGRHDCQLDRCIHSCYTRDERRRSSVSLPVIAWVHVTQTFDRWSVIWTVVYFPHTPLHSDWKGLARVSASVSQYVQHNDSLACGLTSPSALLSVHAIATLIVILMVLVIVQ